MEAVNKLIAYAIPIVVLVLIVIFFFGGTGGFEKVKSAFNKTKSYLPDVSIGAEKLQAAKPTLPAYHEQAVRRLVDKIQTMLSSDRAHCFESYTGLPELKENGGTIIKLSADTITIFTLGGRQEITDLNRELSAKLAGFKPCVVAGPATENFEISFLNEKPWSDKRIVEPLYLPVPEMVIKYDGENKIDFGYGDKDMEDGGILYSPSQGRVCFFPTFDGDNVCSAGDKGLDDDCLGEDPEEDISLPRQLKEGRIIPCTGAGESPAIAQQPATGDGPLPGVVGGGGGGSRA